MKKIILLVVTIFSYCVSFEQDSVLFKIHFQPDFIYDLSVSQKMHMELKYLGADSTLKILEDNGVKNPTVKDHESNIDAIYKVGKPTSNGLMPLRIEFSNGSEKLKGTAMFGTVATDELPVLDSIFSPNLDAKSKKELFTVIQSMYQQISYPNKKMGIGEEYIKKTPLTIPIGADNIKMDAIETYKLISISADSANFEIKLDYVFDMGLPNKNIGAGGGQGKGVLVFDKKNEFLSRSVIQYEMDLTSKQQDVTLKITLVGDVSTICSINKE